MRQFKLKSLRKFLLQIITDTLPTHMLLSHYKVDTKIYPNDLCPSCNVPDNAYHALFECKSAVTENEVISSIYGSKKRYNNFVRAFTCGPNGRINTRNVGILETVCTSFTYFNELYFRENWKQSDEHTTTKRVSSKRRVERERIYKKYGSKTSFFWFMPNFKRGIMPKKGEVSICTNNMNSLYRLFIISYLLAVGICPNNTDEIQNMALDLKLKIMRASLSYLHKRWIDVNIKRHNDIRELDPDDSIT